jgi:endonuclease/exonuclease/phosphatase family metal-dependent hydrolase
MPANTISIIAGDFNTDRANVNDVLAEYGYVEASKNIKPTYGDPNNPYIGKDGSPSIIDRIFVKGPVKVLEAKTVFNSDGAWLSDHHGVLVILEKL